MRPDGVTPGHNDDRAGSASALSAVHPVPPLALPRSGSAGRWRRPGGPATLSARLVPSSPWLVARQRIRSTVGIGGAQAVRGRARHVPGLGASVHRQGDDPPQRRVGSRGHHAQRGVRQVGRQRLPRHGHPDGARWRRGGGLPLQRGHRGGDPARRDQRRRARLDAPQRHLPALLPHPLRRRAEGPLAARNRKRRARHGHRHDGARYRLGPRLDVDHCHSRRRPLRRQRLEDLHHQRHQRRPRDHGGEDRPKPTARGDLTVGDRTGHARVRAGPQPREDRPARAGHR